MIPALLSSETFIFKIIGIIFMISTRAGTEPSFNLRPPEYYFENTKSISLLDAALTGNTPKAKEWVEKGADPNDEGPMTSSYYRLRLLHYAIAAKNPDAVRTLLDVGADPELAALGYGAAFQFAITLNDVAMMKHLLDLRPVPTLSKNTVKKMMFHFVIQPRPACLDLLLNRGAPVDCHDDADYTVMMRAMDAKDYDLAHWLVWRGASVNVEAHDGVTPAYSVQSHLDRYEAGTPNYQKVLRLKELMRARGAVFPPQSPEEVRGQWENRRDARLHQR
jgi:ankyrin repeat protein